MNHSKIAVRYAKALFELAKEKQLTEAIKKDMAIVQTISRSVHEFQLLIDSPTIKSSKKKEIMGKLFSSSMQKLSLDFLYLIIENKREAHIQDIARNFLDIARKDLGIKSANFISAIEINDETAQKIKQITEKVFNTKIDLNLDVKPQILGGYVLRVEDKQFDASISTKLTYVKRHLINDEFEMKL